MEADGLNLFLWPDRVLSHASRIVSRVCTPVLLDVLLWVVSDEGGFRGAPCPTTQFFLPLTPSSVFVPDLLKAMRKTPWVGVAGPRLSRGCGGGAFLKDIRGLSKRVQA